MPRKRKAEGDGSVSGKVAKVEKAPSKNNLNTDVSTLDFSSDAKTSDGQAWNVKLSSWNVNGIRAWLKGDGPSYMQKEQPDILCLQEIKCCKSKIPKECQLEGYHVYWNSADKEGYAGTGLYSKVKPMDIKYGIGIKKHDEEGRVITAEYEKYYLVTAYIPNAGKGLVRLDYRTKEWDVDFTDYLAELEKKKPVILCGDLNVAHQAIDLKNAKSNYNKTAGYTQAEIDGFTNLLGKGFVDTYRKLNPDKTDVYSYWSYMMNARSKNTGWRLDYFVVSEQLLPNLCDSLIRTEVFGSDHCPVVLLLNI